ncbi:MAG: zinc-regulated TonB-dependent outer membrane receptor [Deltaproteobacteria bacterium]|nr:zinc-regulated TonB-dependent outer membrane receptor [Deltaproteobacteria bacterium]
MVRNPALLASVAMLLIARQALGQETPGSIPIDTVQPIVLPIAKLNPDMSFILDVGGAWFRKADHLQQGGHAIDDNGIAIQGLELAASASVDPYFRFDLNFQLTEAEIEEAYLTTLALPGNMQIRAGLMNATFGRENSMHLHVWNFANPPLAHTRFMGEEHLRGPGVELSALMPLPWYLNLIGQALSTTEELGFSSASFAASEMTGSGRINGLEDFLYILRMENFFELSRDWSLLVGLSEGLGQGPYRPSGRAYLHGGDLYLKWRPISTGEGEYALSLTLEYVLRDEPTEEGRLRDHGGYAELDILTTNRWMTGLRFDTTDLWTGTSTDVDEVPGWQRRGCASLTFMPTHFSKLRLQGDLVRDQARDGWGYAIFLQAEVSAGEHGAHKF